MRPFLLSSLCGGPLAAAGRARAQRADPSPPLWPGSRPPLRPVTSHFYYKYAMISDRHRVTGNSGAYSSSGRAAIRHFKPGFKLACGRRAGLGTQAGTEGARGQGAGAGRWGRGPGAAAQAWRGQSRDS